jgi:hypothetical protein
MGELAAVMKEILGADVDLAMISHKHHAPDEECQGVKVMTSTNVPLGNLHNMVMNGMVLVQSAMMQQAMDMRRTRH